MLRCVCSIVKNQSLKVFFRISQTRTHTRTHAHTRTNTHTHTHTHIHTLKSQVRDFDPPRPSGSPQCSLSSTIQAKMLLARQAFSSQRRAESNLGLGPQGPMLATLFHSFQRRAKEAVTGLPRLHSASSAAIDDSKYRPSILFVLKSAESCILFVFFLCAESLSM